MGARAASERLCHSNPESQDLETPKAGELPRSSGMLIGTLGRARGHGAECEPRTKEWPYLPERAEEEHEREEDREDACGQEEPRPRTRSEEEV